MGEEADRLERRIQQQRRALRDNMMEFRQTVGRAVDWRSQCEERPVTMVGLAFAGGLVLSVLIGGRSRSTSRKPLPDRRSTSADDSAFRRADVERRSTTSAQAQAVAGGTWETLKAALVGVAATKLKSLIDERLPGFQEEYRKVEAGRRAFSSGPAQ